MKAINAKRVKNIATCAIIVGILLYLSKFLRPYFGDNDAILFVLGFLPNFGLAMAMPFIYVSNRIRLDKPINHFSISCIITLALMILNEIRDKYQSGRVFDWCDIYASIVGVIFSFLVFKLLVKSSNEPD